MRIPALVFVTVVCIPFPSLAASISNDMTCEQAIAYYEEHESIDAEQDGSVMQIRQGTPIRKATLLQCDEGDSRFDTMVKTKDKEQCTIAAYCE